MLKLLVNKIKPNSEKTKLRSLKLQCKNTITTMLAFCKKYSVRHCILVIGQPESGKSTLCAQAGTLLFSSIENTTANEFIFEIYLKNNALFLHVPQGFFLFSDTILQQDAWSFLATCFKHHRTSLPITRCVICIDIHDFLTRSLISNETRLAQISLALNIFANKVKSPIEISLFFTKADLLTGFNEFFDHQNKEYLEQPWGIYLRAFPEDNFINTEFDQLIKKLNEQLLWRIHHEVHMENVYLIKSFPIIMETTKQKMQENIPKFLAQWAKKKLLIPAELYLISCRQYRELNRVQRV